MSNMIIEALLAVSLFSPITAVYAQDLLKDDKPVFKISEVEDARTDPDYHTINPASIKITRVEVAEEKDFSYLGPVKAEKDPLVVIDQIINIFTKVWTIIQQNAPVVNIDTKYAAAMPQGITGWNQLAEWKKPKTYLYSFYAENIYGVKTIDVTYKMMYTSGGRYKGKGLYLTGVTVVPTNVDVAWGYRFSLAAAVADSTIANVGTELDPVASMQMKLAWKISTALKDSNGTSVYYIQGDGYYEEIASPWAKEAVKVEDIKSAAPLMLDPSKVFAQ